MSKSHDQRCLDSNRFGDGFDCNCEPDWKALYLAAKARIAELEKECEGHIQAYLGLNAGLLGYETRIAQAVAELEKALVRKSPWRAHIVVALKALR